MSTSELLKKAKLSRYNLEFCGMGLVPILSHTDADVARAFSHKSVCRMNHLDVRHCWLREELRNGNYRVKRVDRKFNASDMLTHSPSAEELRKFLSMTGCQTMTVKRENFNAVKTMLKRMPAPKITAFLASMGGNESFWCWWVCFFCGFFWQWPGGTISLERRVCS